MSDSGISAIVRPQALRATTLDAWSASDWSGGIDVSALAAFDELTVTTKNSVYTIVIVSPHSGAVKVRGGNAFPSFADALLSGSSLGGGLLRRHLVHPGFCLELTHKGLGRIVTTRVRTVSLVRGNERGSPTPVM
jgi:hypothetical protein